MGYGSRLSAIWTAVKGSRTMKIDCEVIYATARFYWTETDHLKGSWTWSNHPLTLTRTDALSPEELDGHSTSGPIIRVGTAGPIDDWGEAAPKRSNIWSFMVERRASCMSFIQAWTFSSVWDDAGGTWEGVTAAWDDEGTGARVVTADTGVEGTGGPARRRGWSGKGVGPTVDPTGPRERRRGIRGKIGTSTGMGWGGVGWGGVCVCRKWCFWLMVSSEQGEVQDG